MDHFNYSGLLNRKDNNELIRSDKKFFMESICC